MVKVYFYINVAVFFKYFITWFIILISELVFNVFKKETRKFRNKLHTHLSYILFHLHGLSLLKNLKLEQIFAVLH